MGCSLKRSAVDPESCGLSISRQCRLLDIGRTSLYYTPRTSDQNKQLMDKIDELFTEDPTRGTRRLSGAMRRRYSINVGRSKIRSLMARMGLRAICRRVNTSRPDRSHRKYPYLLRGVAVVRPNQVWCTDITYIRLKGGFAYLCVIMDWYSRCVLSWRLSTSLESRFCIDALEEALATHDTPEIFNSDQGSQFTSEEFTSVLLDHGVKISMDGKGRALDNVFVERLWRTVKYEHIFLRDYRSVQDCREGLGTYLEWYNRKREHSSLNDHPPYEIYIGRERLPLAA